MESIDEEISELNLEFEQLKVKHENYLQQVDRVKDEQSKCLASVNHQEYRLNQIEKELKKNSDPNKKRSLNEIIALRREELRDIKDTLPRPNGIYLSIVLGQVNVSLLSKRDKFAYKHDYERFKLTVTGISLICSLLCCFFIDNRVLDNAYFFLLLWYFCTLTIREHILITNGSRIKGWWLNYHFISTVLFGIILIWPKEASYYVFRQQFMYYTAYTNIIQGLQYYYQRGSLYKMRALGKRHNMDITVDGAMRWMLINVTFLLPFLIAGYLFQFFNAITLYRLSYDPQCTEWQVTALSLIFLIISVMNLFTTLQVILRKFLIRPLDVLFGLPNKYRFYSKRLTTHPNDSPCKQD